MKTLLLLRHADAEPGSASGSDHERALTERGRRDARRMGRFLAEAGAVPDHVITSSATRTRQTLEEATAGGGWSRPAQATDALYDTTPAATLAAIQAAPAEANALLLVGHEPTWSTVAGRLIGMAQVRMPTAALACISFDADDWADADFGIGTLHWLVAPEVLGAT